MTEEDIIKFSAKALGLELDYRRSSDAFYYDDQETGREVWLPMHDDRQTMLIIAKLRMDICCLHHLARATTHVPYVGFKQSEVPHADEPGDRMKALRLAVATVAAKYGQGMLTGGTDERVLGHLIGIEGSTAHAMRGAVRESREEISKACQRLKRKGLVTNKGSFWQAVQR
ncbi:hypothetical protein [Pseudomonas sp. CIP-10]|uniref:hypothetical protein n=1 Tax=Pseudomonas sp. CIP-10 TaxID=2892442 RepID=UPI001E518804|nr:hypothetical protein [Pseudomonas sp. CIP-10]UFH28787.1 hypothetical protein LMH93_09350 [Pseudomonas sp. CIP-10]